MQRAWVVGSKILTMPCHAIVMFVMSVLKHAHLIVIFAIRVPVAESDPLHVMDFFAVDGQIQNDIVRDAG